MELAGTVQNQHTRCQQPIGAASIKSMIDASFFFVADLEAKLRRRRCFERAPIALNWRYGR